MGPGGWEGAGWVSERMWAGHHEPRTPAWTTVCIVGRTLLRGSAPGTTMSLGTAPGNRGVPADPDFAHLGNAHAL